MRLVLFDVDGVLVHGYHTKLERQRRWDVSLEADFGIRPEDFREHFIKGPFVSEVLTGRVSLVSALEVALPQLGFTGSPMTLIRYWLERDSQVNHPLLELLARLRHTGAAKLCVATNQEHLRAFHLWSNLGFHQVFEDMFHSARLGALKPDSRFFERIVQLTGHPATKPLMFDDSPDVVAAADAAGWEGVLFDDLSDCAEHPWIRRQIKK